MTEVIYFNIGFVHTHNKENTKNFEILLSSTEIQFIFIFFSQTFN